MTPGDASVFITTLPSFVDFSEVFNFKPKPGNLGVHTIRGYLSDGTPLQKTTPFSFQVKVINKAPVFMTKLEELRVKVGRSARYIIPEIEDDDPQGVSISILHKGSTRLPGFATFDYKSRTLIISPR